MTTATDTSRSSGLANESGKRSATAAGDATTRQSGRRTLPDGLINPNARSTEPSGPSTPTATWYAVKGPNGDLTWRVESPAYIVGAKVQYIPDDIGAAVLFWPNRTRAFPWKIEAEHEDGRVIRYSSKTAWQKATKKALRLRELRTIYPVQEGSTAVWCRPLAWPAAHMLRMRNEHGLRIVAEVDDNYLSQQHLNVFMMKGEWGKEARDNHAKSILSADAIIVSTAYLRDTYWKLLKDYCRDLSRQYGYKVECPPIFVCRNHVDERFVPKELVPPRNDGRLRIGFMGSDSHIWDISLIYDALAEAYELGHEIVFVGINPAMLNPKYLRADKRKDWANIRYTHIPWKNQNYRGTALPLDIGLAPLRVDNHTLCKSDIKWMEYALSGAATVAQNCAVFNRTAVHGETAMLASSPAEFRDRMLDLIKNESLRQRLVANTRQYIQEERLLTNNAAEWREAVLG